MVKLQEKIKELNAESGLHLQYIEDAGKTYNKLLNRTAGLDSAPSVIALLVMVKIKAKIINLSTLTKLVIR